MKIYQPSSKQNFLEEVTNIIINHHQGNFENLKILLPGGLACSRLQRSIIEKLGASTLPQIESMDKLCFVNEETFNLPSREFGSVTRLEEHILLAQIIYDYQKLNYNKLQSLQLSHSLANLFFEFEVYQIDVSQLSDLTGLDKSAHWIELHSFIEYLYYTWQKKIAELGKLTKAKYYKDILNSELIFLKKDTKNHLILVGIDSEDPVISNFLNLLVSYENASLILPPCPAKDKITDEQQQYIPKIYHLFKGRIPLANPCEDSIFDPLLSRKKTNIQLDSIKYIEFDNILQEAEYIALFCAEYIKNNPSKSIALLAHNQQIKNYHTLYLKKYDLAYSDRLGSELLNNPIISFLLAVSKLLYHRFSLQNFVSLLSHPIFIDENNRNIIYLLRKNTRFANDFSDVISIIEQYGEADLAEYTKFLISHLDRKIESNKFQELLANLLNCAASLKSDLWQDADDIATSLNEIYQFQYSFTIEQTEDFGDILRQILQGGRVFSQSAHTNIIITKPSDIKFLNYDLVIMSNMNEDTYPNIKSFNPWISHDLQNKLGLEDSQDKFNKAFYEFYLNLQNTKLLLTRSKRDASNKSTIASQFLLTLKNSYKLPSSHGKADRKYAENLQREYADSSCFPSIIYATDIEMLIKAPYNFYAKKVLGLRKLEEITNKPSLAEFGSIFHAIMEEFSNKYQQIGQDKKLALCQIISQTIDQTKLPDISRKLWSTKILNMADEIIEFEQQRRAANQHIYNEIKGSIKLNIAEKQVEIAAIADRIEVSEKGEVTILDYKTGQVPLKQEVLSGVAPQLLIEAIIFLGGGFGKIVNYHNCNKFKLVYIKINSKAPYLAETVIEIRKEELLKHKDGLIKLLEYYIQNGKYYIEHCEMRYDDYAKLAGRLS